MRLIDADALKVKWYTEKTNRNDPIWEFKCFGHHGEVVWGGDKTKWSAKLDNSGRFGYATAAEAKSTVEVWLKSMIVKNIKIVNSHFARYEDLINTTNDLPDLEVVGHQRLSADNIWINLLGIGDIPHYRDNRGQKIRTLYAQKSNDGEYL